VFAPRYAVDSRPMILTLPAIGSPGGSDKTLRCLFALLLEQLVRQRSAVNRQAVVVLDAAQLRDLLRVAFELQQGPHLAVAVLIDDVDALVHVDEVEDLLRERIAAEPEVRRVHL